MIRAHAPREERGDPPLAFSLDGKSLALWAGSFENEVQLLEVATGGLRARFETKPSIGSAFAFVDSGRVLALAEGNDVVLRDVRADKELLRLKGHQGQVTSLAFDARSDKLFSGSHDSTVLVWDLAALRRAPRRK